VNPNPTLHPANSDNHTDASNGLSSQSERNVRPKPLPGEKDIAGVSTRSRGYVSDLPGGQAPCLSKKLGHVRGRRAVGSGGEVDRGGRLLGSGPDRGV
jgi:hypothetical protein